tara:strand:+ start:552 stop:1868 length:1317 start_codon:yes stop_codon:yes gene_type:complete
MGSVFRAAKKVVKKVAKPITKVVKKVAKKVVKIGKSVMKGVSKISNKLGPLGMIAMSIAMPYALGGLSSMIGTAGGTTGLMNSSNLFLKSIGTIGNQIRTGYQAFNTFASTAKQSISKVIGDTFTKFAPKGTGNIFSRISQGAKNLYTAGKNKLKSVMPKPFTAKGGTVEFFGAADPGVGIMQSTDAASALTRGTLKASELGKQTLTEAGGWFTKTNSSGITADRLVTETINDAYKARLDGFGTNASRMFNDIKSKALEMDTYINDEQIGSFVESNKAAQTYTNEIMEYAGDMDYAGTGTGKYQLKTEIPDLSQTGDYTLGTARDRLEGTYNFTGGETFGKQPATNSFLTRASSAAAKAGGDMLKGLLTPNGMPEAVAPIVSAVPDYSAVNGANYSGTDQKGSQGGSLVAQVYGENAANRIKNYYQNMNLLNSGDSYI